MVLKYFALIVLLVVGIAVLAGVVILGYLPGKIARDRNHPQADAINVCGWFGALSLGLLLPLAYIWAYTNPRWQESEDNRSATANNSEEATG